MSHTNLPAGERPPRSASGAVPPAQSPVISAAAAPLAQPLFTNGKAGVGLFFQEEKKELIVRNIVPGGSAAADGRIEAGDIIVSVDGKSVEGQGIETLRDCIIGSVGTFVELTFRRLQGAGVRTSFDGPTLYSITLERKSQTKPVNNGQPEHNAAPQNAAPRPDALADANEASALELQKLHRRVSNLTFEKADLQSLLDQKNALAESRSKTMEMLEMQLQVRVSCDRCDVTCDISCRAQSRRTSA
jgi:hypothetical protein